MSTHSQIGNYVVISPVKDEATRVRTTIESVVAQSVRPLMWVIVDDGSSDGTAQILERYARQHAWIRIVCRRNERSRRPGAAVINAFRLGLEFVDAECPHFIVKLDCDVKLPTSYFEYLLERFAEDP